MEYQYIETTTQLEHFAEENKDITWIGFDTEFIGEKRYYPTLCLIQAITENGVYVIDTMVLENIDLFLQIIENEKITKVTHAGDNDYRVLNSLFGTMPKNLFDTQLAAGFLTNTYPMSFQKLAEKELKVKLSKAFTVTDWETRPVSKKQLTYALNDVIYLPKLWQQLADRLAELGRTHWLSEEIAKLESKDYYEVDPLKEVLQSNLTPNLAQREQIFLIRLMAWRREEAERRNQSKEMVMPTKTVTMIVKNINQGKAALRQNRIISDKTINNYWDTFNDLFQAKMTDEEKSWLGRIPQTEEETPEQALSSEFLYLLLRERCLKATVAHSLIMSKSLLRENSSNESFVDNTLNKGWRKELLGENLIQWIKSQQLVTFEVLENHCIVKMVE
jgi:ribonuclease D